MNERRLKEINKREEKRKIQREKYKLNLELRNKLIELFIKEKKKGNKIAFELFENLKDDKRNINEVLYNKYCNILYSES